MPTNTWTPEKIALLKELFPKTPKKDIMSTISGSWGNIRKKANSLNLIRDLQIIHEDRLKRKLRSDGLQSDEIILLKKIYENNSKEGILKQINRSWNLITKNARKLDLKRDPDLINFDRKKRGSRKDSYNKKELDLIIDIYENNKKEFILDQFKKAGFKRSWQSIRHTAISLNIKRNQEIVKQEMIDGGSQILCPPCETLWTEKENEHLKTVYTNNSKEYILSQLPERTWRAVREHALKIGLSRSSQAIATDSKKHLKENLGVDSTWQLESVKEKSRQTNLKKRGVEYPTQSAEVREKVKETVQKRYGVNNVFQSEEIKEKIEHTNIKRYGSPFPNQNEEVRKKSCNTNIKKYGVKNPFQLVDRVQKGVLKKYGKKSPQQVPEIREKTERANLERYGYKTPAQNQKIKEKLSIILQTDEVKIKKYKTSKKNNTLGTSKEENIFFNHIKKIDTKTKRHQLHPEIKHVIDFYMPQYYLWVQYDGIYWHGKTGAKDIKGKRGKRIQKTIEQDHFQNNSIPNLIRFWSDNVTEALKTNSLLTLIKTKIDKKIKNLKPVCHQYKKKIEWYNEDIKNLPFNSENIKVLDFSLQPESLSTEIKEFIERYEWLGSIGVTPKWCFTARYKKLLGGVILINEPTAYSKILGRNTHIYEALIQRGASASWTPKNLGSHLIMYSCKWMVKNTQKRAFTAYSDPAAHELGIIYQACNFDYLGNSFGNKYLYRHPKINHIFSSQSLKRTSAFKKWCKENEIEIEKTWFNEKGFKKLENIPEKIKISWYQRITKLLLESKKIEIKKKMKYVLILGRNKREKKYLKNIKTYDYLPYPLKNLGSITTPQKIQHPTGSTRDRKTTKKIQFLIDNFGKMSRPELVKELDETKRWVKRQLAKLSREGKIKTRTKS